MTGDRADAHPGRFLAQLVLVTATAALAGTAGAQEAPEAWHRVSLIQMPYTGARNVPELSDNPEYLYRHGIASGDKAPTFDGFREILGFVHVFY